MIRKLTYADVPAMIEVIKTRDKFMSSKESMLTTYGFIEDENNFNKNLSLGYFTEDGALDAFIFNNIWEELPVFSSLVYTRKRENRIKDSETNVDSILILLWQQVDIEMGKLGIFESFQLIAANGWRHTWGNNTKYLYDIVEIVPERELSKYLVFRLRLSNRRYEFPVKISRRILLPEFRNVEP